MSDTFIPAANVWVGEYPYLDKVRQTAVFHGEQGEHLPTSQEAVRNSRRGFPPDYYRQICRFRGVIWVPVKSGRRPCLCLCRSVSSTLLRVSASATTTEPPAFFLLGPLQILHRRL